MDQIHTKNWAWSAKSNRSTGKADADAELAFAISVSNVHWNGYSGSRDEKSIIPVTTLSTLRQAQDLELSQSLKSEKFKTSNRFHPEDLPKNEVPNIFQFTTVHLCVSTKQMENPWILTMFHQWLPGRSCRIHQLNPFFRPRGELDLTRNESSFNTASKESNCFCHMQMGGELFTSDLFRIYHPRLLVKTGKNLKISKYNI